MSYEIINTSVAEYKKLVESLHTESYEMVVDLTVVDWFRKKEPRFEVVVQFLSCLLYTSPSPRDGIGSRMPSSA